MPNNAKEPDQLLRDALSNFGTFFNALINFKVFVTPHPSRQKRRWAGRGLLPGR